MRRAKLYYLRGLTGKRARIAEKVERKLGLVLDGNGASGRDLGAEEVAASAAAATGAAAEGGKKKRKGKDAE